MSEAVFNNLSELPEGTDEKSIDELISVMNSHFDNLYNAKESYSPGVKNVFELIKQSEKDDTIKQGIDKLNSDKESVDKIIAVGKEKGFDFNESDLNEFFQITFEPDGDELDGVAGGGRSWKFWVGLALVVGGTVGLAAKGTGAAAIKVGLYFMANS